MKEIKSLIKDKKSRVIIVGNSPSVLENKYGHVIDSYDVVIRVNKCVTKGFEAHVGTKTNIWATSQNLAKWYGKDFIPDNFNDLDCIWKRTRHTQLGSIPEDIDKPFYVMYKRKDGYNVLAAHKVNKLKHEPDTGFLTILTALRFFKDITITGFTFYTEYGQSDDLNTPTSYYRDLEFEQGIRDPEDPTKHPEDKLWARAKEIGVANEVEGKRKLKIIGNYIEKGDIKVLEDVVKNGV